MYPRTRFRFPMRLGRAAAVAFLVALAAAADAPASSIGQRASAHASDLAARGPRPAASAGEADAARYVRERLEAAGLAVTVERFTFEDFETGAVTLTLAGRTVEPVLLGIDPFGHATAYSGDAVIVAGGEAPGGDVAGRVVVTDSPMTQLLIAESDPAAVVCVGSDDLARFAGQPDRSMTLRVDGTRRVRESRNVIGTLGPAGGRRVLVTAHLDAYRDSPGANDNGTGLGALVELARSLASDAGDLTREVTFIAFGAEEVGAAGSRAFVERHRAELADVIAVVNLDTLGGHDGPQLGSAAGVDPSAGDGDGAEVPPGLRGKAWEGLDGRWRMLHPAILRQVTVTNSPPWLETAAAAAAGDAGVDLGRRSLISDHRAFTAAGVPATSIQSGRHTIHTPADTPDRIDVDTVDAGCRVALGLVRRLAGSGTADGAADGNREPGPS